MMRQSRVLRRIGVWSAILATVLHVALLSLHVTASFERAIAAPGDVAALSASVLCGPGLSTQLAEDGSSLPDWSGKSATRCPFCTSAAPVACLTAPQLEAELIVFDHLEALPPPVETLPIFRRKQFDGTIRGPPARV